MITRFSEGKILAGIIRLLGVGIVLWIVDMIMVIVSGRILRLLPI
ncbi:MAG: hypothetical protein SPD42_01345 [Eubacteriales bacterium]|nr:hypothetical protein [Eubacteriales bacterium]